MPRTKATTIDFMFSLPRSLPLALFHSLSQHTHTHSRIQCKLCKCVRACVKCKTSTIQPFEIANKIDAYTKFDDTVSMRNVLLIQYDGNFYSTRFLRLFFPFTSFNDPSPLNDYVRRQVCSLVMVKARYLIYSPMTLAMSRFLFLPKKWLELQFYAILCVS